MDKPTWWRIPGNILFFKWGIKKESRWKALESTGQVNEELIPGTAPSTMDGPEAS